MPAYPPEYKQEFEQALGKWEREDEEADLLPGWSFESAGSARLVDGGMEVLVREIAVDSWILPQMEDRRKKLEKDVLGSEQSPLSEEERQAMVDFAGVGTLREPELSRMVTHVEGFLLFREGFLPSTSYPLLPAASRASTSSGAPTSTTTPKPDLFVPTPLTSTLLRTLAFHVIHRIPVLVSSPPSSGKFSSINHLWTLLHSSPSTHASTTTARQRSLVQINLADRSLDSKSLLGSLSSAPSTSDAEAGSFMFVEGPLTRAVRQGRWVVLSSIDQASVEVLSVIKVLVERMRRASERTIGGAWGGGGNEESGGVGVRVGGGDGRWVTAGRGFMLFATRSADSQGNEPVFFSSGFWSNVWMDGPRREDIKLIVEGRYPRLKKAGLVERLIDTWTEVRQVGAKDGAAGTNRSIGVRDLMRWCRRTEGLLPRDVAITSIDSNPILQEEIFTEARDVFLGSLPVPSTYTSIPDSSQRDRYSLIALILASGLGLSPERAEWVIRRRVPELVLPLRDEDDGRVSTAEQTLKVGRVALPYRPNPRHAASSRPYALTKPSLTILEKLAVAVRLSEPVLMVGETGTGKTAAVGHLADLLGKNLTALNLSNQTEAGDLVGGFKPIDENEEARRTASELVNHFIELFGKTFSLSRNAEYVSHVRKAFEKKRWQRLVGLWREAFRMASDRLGIVPQEPAASARKRRKMNLETSASDLPSAWHKFLSLVGDFDLRHVSKAGKNKFVFSFVEGPLAKAIRNGDWVLLDEVNLASSETLESLSTLLQSPDSSLVLSEQGDLEPIPRHPDFRLFACMNPATDVGKRDLPPGLRAKFSELWVPPPDEDRDALLTIVQGYIGRIAVQDRAVILDVAELYSAVKSLALSGQLADGANSPPHFSMRTLARALTFASEFGPTFGLRRALYEGFLMAFTMLLDLKSSSLVKALLDQHIVSKAKNKGSLFAQVPAKPSGAESIRFGPYWLATGSEPLQEASEYILTPSVQAKVLDLARAVLTRKVPVLIQGPTSAGKTSVVEYLARRTGHRFVRINNHEHTDIQEYIGTYVSDSKSGKLVFQEGMLVRALRNGDWIVLDELNLAPTDVLEALNRLLDDNRELVIPETGEVVRPHPHFMLFATQNPPGLYGGRKVLSRAFRNRFLEMHFGDVPQDELETILCQRCQIAPSYAKKAVAVFVELQRRRQAGRVFEQKHAFATLRDLFRWGGRGSVGYQQLAEDGYMLLAERARRLDDKAVVKEVIELEMRVKIDAATLYDFARLSELGLPAPIPNDGLVWTNAMRRLYFLIAAALKRNEPVLLVGETGSGKTSVCQSLALALDSQLHVVGCHQNTETADLLGGQRPLRNRAALQAAGREEITSFLASRGVDTPFSAADDIETFIDLLEKFEKTGIDEVDGAIATALDRLKATTALFEWHDGPLVQAMHGGDLILLDEISLADDSVLERLNSVLEPSRTLVLAEKGGRDLSDILVVGADGFKILATMNPGGDFGKKELSPALRNRFTEIWVPHVDQIDDLLQIIGSRWRDACLKVYGALILEFGSWFRGTVGITDGLGISLRDILAWVDFLNAAWERLSSSISDVLLHQSLDDAFREGAYMTVVDGLGALPITSGLSKSALLNLRTTCGEKLAALTSAATAQTSAPKPLDVTTSQTSFSIGSFSVPNGPVSVPAIDYTLQAPTTRLNAFRLLRAMQLKKPILLEGSPGVGKTSLVTALAAATGNPLVRINLSDQTDLMDLLGSDLPVEGGRSGEFAWKDAPFLAAMQQGSWVLLDEMNLASQSVLEGLNSSLDHRGTVYIPELDRSFARHPNFRIFAAQNPLGQGGGRKGLPRSFLDRFSIVHMEELDTTDLNVIATSLYPEIDPAMVQQMIAFNVEVHRRTMEVRAFGASGSPWEFNLRDVLRWLSLLRAATGLDSARGQALEYVGLLYFQRFRTDSDRSQVAHLFNERFGTSIDHATKPSRFVSTQSVLVGHSLVPRSDSTISGRPTASSPLSSPLSQPFEALAKCVEMGWLAILTGARGTGKTTLVRQLAAFHGRPLKEFSMNSEVDTLELLGSFEQAEKFRELHHITSATIQLVEHKIVRTTTEDDVCTMHTTLTCLRQLQLTLSLNSPGFDLTEASALLLEALDYVQDLEAGQVQLDRLRMATTKLNTSARFEWVDGPLVQAMKDGSWLLIEDANLCSPSVLDRLNSLFEQGGRLQLGERGPVNGEIQIIEPHKDFRMIMSLDPYHGELSRAMRNRGIEIALLPTSSDSPISSPVVSSTSLAAASSNSNYIPTCLPEEYNEFAEADSASILRLLSIPVANTSNTSISRVLLESLSRPVHALATRLTRGFGIFSDLPLDVAIRRFRLSPIAQALDVVKHDTAKSRGVSYEILASQPVDSALAPLIVAEAHPRNTHISTSLDILTSALLTSTSQPHLIRLVSSKPHRGLDVWERSFLAAHGKLRLDEEDSALIALAPVSLALASLVNHLLEQSTLDSSVVSSTALVPRACELQNLLLELRAVTESSAVDFTSIQHLAAWIAKIVDELPQDPVLDNLRSHLAPLRQSLFSASGRAMSEIWKASLPLQTSNGRLNEALQKLLQAGARSHEVILEKSLAALFVDIAVTLGAAPVSGTLGLEEGAIKVVEDLVKRLPTAALSTESKLDLELSWASNTASLAVAELTAVSEVAHGSEDSRASAEIFSDVARASGAVSLESVVPINQLICSKPTETAPGSRPHLVFGVLLGWSHRAAVGLKGVTQLTTAEIIRPVLLRAVNDLRTAQGSTLGNLVVASKSMQRAATLQAQAAHEHRPRILSFNSILTTAIDFTQSVALDTPRSTLSTTSTEQDVFEEAFDLYLTPVLNSMDRLNPSIADVGEGFIAFARTFWHLYVPTIPLDPAVGLRARSTYLSHTLQGLTDFLEAHHKHELLLTGNQGSAKLSLLLASVRSMRQQYSEAGEVPIAREGDPALLSSLFKEMNSVREQIIGDSQVESLLNAVRGPWSTDVKSRESNLQQSLTMLLHRLETMYQSVSDILAPIRLALACFKIGFALAHHACFVRAMDTDSRLLASLLRHLIGFPTIAHTRSIEMAELPLKVKANEGILSPTRATLLQLATLNCRMSAEGGFDKSSLHRLISLYDRIHYLWSVDRKHAEEEAQQAASLYRMKTDVHQIASDEELEAAEFAELFPTFKDVTEEVDEPATTSSAPATVSSPRHLRPGDQTVLARLHLNMFMDASTVAAPVNFEAVRSGVISSILPGLFDFLDESLDQDSAVYRIRTLVELGQQLAPDAPVSTSRDFYTEPDVKETCKVVPIIKSLAERLSGLIELWPDQMVLRNLLERCEKIIALSSQSPIAQVLMAIEKLLSHTEDWESYASREHSLVTNRTAITNLIVEWRRLELTCWSRLLSTVEVRFGDAASDWWFRFYETFIRGAPGVDFSVAEEAEVQTGSTYYHDLVTLLNSFFTESSLGQYQPRLDLVHSFAQLTHKLGHESDIEGASSLQHVSRILENVHSFYDQFSPRVQAFLKAERVRIDKDVQGLIKLASWKDVNVYALRQSAIKSHHQLYKSVRKLRAVLQKPASDFFTVNDVPDAGPQTAPLRSFLSQSIDPLPPAPVGLESKTRARHLQQLDQTFARLTGLVNASLYNLVEKEQGAGIEGFSLGIITTAKELRDQSVLGPEEGREQRVKSLTQRKRRAWIELLRELKRVGVSPTPAPEIVARLKDAGFVYGLRSSRSLLDTISTDYLSDSTRFLLEKVHWYHFRLLADLPALRNAPVTHHEDVSTREILRAVGSVESCIHMGFKNLEQLVDSLHQQARLTAVLRRLELVEADPQTGQANATCSHITFGLLRTVSSVIHALQEAASELDRSQLARGVASKSDFQDVVDWSVQLLLTDRILLEDLHRSSRGLGEITVSTPREVQVFNEARAHLSSVFEKLAAVPTSPALCYISRPLVAWLSTAQFSFFDDDTYAVTSNWLQQLDQRHADIVDGVLVVAQDLQKMIRDENSSAESTGEDIEEIPDHAVKLSNHSFAQVMRSLRLSEMRERVDAFATSIHQTIPDPTCKPATAAILGRTLPFIRLYKSLVDRHLTSYLRWHKASLKLSHVVSSIVRELSISGFCKPADAEEKGGDTGTDGKTSDGTGMADGRGAKNVSNEIEDESQVEGLEGEMDQSDEKPEEQEGDDDAVEMSNDFEGKMEDRGDGEKQEDENDDEESDGESEPEPEEQMADVDPLDPSSVDEKFWGEEGKNEGKTDEINQEASKADGESEMAAKDNDAPAPQPKGEEEKEGAEQPDKEGKKEESGQPQEGEELDDNGDGDQQDNGEAEDEGGEDNDEENAAHAESGDKLDDKLPEAENLDLPEDMQLDADEKKGDNEEDFGSDMGDLDEPADAEEGENAENDNLPDETIESGEPNQDGNDDDILAPPDSQQGAESDEMQEPEEDKSTALDHSLGGADNGETGGEGAQDSTSAAKPDKNLDSDLSQRQGAQAETVVTESAGQDPDLEEMDAEDGPNEDEESAPTTASNAANGRTKERAGNDPSTDFSKSQQNSSASSEQQAQRSLGDALQSWRRRLETISDLDTSNDAPEQTAVDSSAPENSNGEVEYVPEGAQRDQDTQALGPAREDQVNGIEQLSLEEEGDGERAAEQDSMDVDNEPSTSKNQPPASISLTNGSSLAELTEKAIPADELRTDHDPLAGSDPELESMEDDINDVTSNTLAPPLEHTNPQEAVEEAMLQWRAGDNQSMDAEGVWRLYEALTRDLSYALTEQLRLILEPTLATRLKGDYRSGKRLNMKKIIPYIASEFTKDKIWLRRTRPSQREYQILIAIDDSKSMADSHSVHLAYQTLALISRSLARLEVGGISICRFGDTMDVLHPFESGAIGDEAGAALLSKFTFAQRTTDVRLLVERSLVHLAQAKHGAAAGKSSLAAGDLWQLQIIISDGMCQDHDKLRALLRKAAEQKVLFVFVVIDSLHQRAADNNGGSRSGSSTPNPATADQNSILAMQSVSYTKGPNGQLELKMDRYLDSFPFDYFVVLRDVEALPDVLCATLRDFFEKASAQ
ncbi:P-loop containing nucleoside triphosphate hydrolase protein [Meredithblackwellia eburnea MCA 4105]